MEVVFRDPEGREPSLLGRLRETYDVPQPIPRWVGRIIVHDRERAQPHVAATGTE